MRYFKTNRIDAREGAADLAALLQAIQQGDQEALGQFYDLTLGKVYGLVLRILANVADAEEVTCDVFHQVWRSAKQFDCQRGNPSQWLMVIARSRALDRYRERRARRHEVHAEVHLPECPDTYSMSTIADCGEIAQEFQSGSAVQLAMTALNSIQVELVTLAFFQGLTHQEIADLKKLPLGTVKSHINRAVAELRKSLSVSDFR